MASSQYLNGQTEDLKGHHRTTMLVDRQLGAEETVDPAPSEEDFSRIVETINRQMDAWREAGVDFEFDSAVGPAFWATQEITDCPSLIEQTTSRFASVIN